MLDESFFEVVDDPDVAFYMHYSRLEKFKTRVHTHHKAQLLYAEGGVVHVFINDRHWYLPARCYMWIPAESPHAIISYSNNIELFGFYFKVDPEEASFYKEANIYFVDDMLREMILFSKKWQGAVDKTQVAAYNFLQAIKSILPDFHSNQIPFSIQHPFPKDEKLIEIGSFLLKNIDKNYTIDEIAKKFGISVRSLSRKFKEHMGMNYVRFLRSLRITKALELIAENKYNTLEVALLVGYSSLSAFSNVFYKITGLRPTDYAKLLNK